MPQLPALSIVATPGRRRQAIEMAQEAERRGFSGIFVPSFYDGMGFCELLAMATNRIKLGTSIANIYTRHPTEYAATAATIQEISGGRFYFGIGVSHGPVHSQLRVTPGRPLKDIRDFVEGMGGGGQRGGPGELPPVVLATLRQKMVELASEIGQGAVWANGARSHMGASLQHLTPEQRDGDFFIGDMVPTCVSDDKEAAAAVNRRTLMGYVRLPNYRNYWKEAGYVEEMEGIERAVAAGETDKIEGFMTERWLSDVTLYGSAAEVRDGIEAWFASGVKTPIIVPSSTSGGQAKAVQEVFAALA